MENKAQINHNCNMCENVKMFIGLGNVCCGKKYRGKIINKDDTICDEYEFGGFTELLEEISHLPNNGIADNGLKPCPFCGSKAEFVTKTSNMQGIERGFSFQIECSKCGTHINRKPYELKLKLSNKGHIENVIDERQLAVDEWNKRVDAQQLH